ncbi:MAG: lipoyl domain-containing protein [Solirubrobacterales bacterium]
MQPGDQVEVGQEIAEIETDKANMAYESELAGTVLELLVQENETAAVGAVIALVGEPGGARSLPHRDPVATEPTRHLRRRFLQGLPTGPARTRRARGPRLRRSLAALRRSWECTCQGCSAPGPAAGS